jgi:hypothetical protein
MPDTLSSTLQQALAAEFASYGSIAVSRPGQLATACVTAV